MCTTHDIKAIRMKLDWTQDQMAEYLGVDRSSVSRMEKGSPISGPVSKLLAHLEANSPGPEPQPEAAE